MWSQTLVTRYRLPARFSAAELLRQPEQQLALIERGCPADLDQQFVEFWPLQGEVGRTFIANRANRAQVMRLVNAAHAFVNHMTQMQPRLAAWVERMRLARDCTAHLAGKAVSVQHESARFFRYAARECGLGRVSWKAFPSVKLSLSLKEIAESLVCFIGVLDEIAVILLRIRHRGFASSLAHDEQAAPVISAGSHTEQHLSPKVQQQQCRRIHTLTQPFLSAWARYGIKMQFL